LAAPVVAGLTIATDTGSSNNDGITANATPTLVGAAPAGTTVQVFDGASALGTTTADVAGAWSFTPAAALVDGAHLITAIATDAAGNASAGSAARTITITAASPPSPTITGLTAATDTGTSAADGLTRDAMPTLTGVAAANALIQVFDGATQLGSAQADGAGAWSFTPAAALAAGVHSLTAKATNSAGAVGAASTAFTLTVDLTPPAAPAITGLTAASDSGPSSTDGITSVASPTLVGTAAPNVIIKVLDGATLLGTTAADATGNWTFTPVAPLLGGSHAVVAVAVDAAGNAGAASPAYALVIGGAAPATPVVLGLTAATDTGSSNTDNITGIATPTIQGTTAANGIVQVFDGVALLGTATADGTGAWTLTPAAALASGNHAISAVAVDGAGATSAASVAMNIVIDDGIPASPAITGLAAGSDSGASAVDHLTSNTLPTLTGVAPADAQVQVSDGATVLGTALADHAGAWSFTPAAALAEGQHGLTATAISASGTAGSASSQFDVTIDTQGPAAPVLTGLTAATDSGSSATDALTNNATPTLVGTSEGNAVIKVYDGATLLGSATADNAGAWAFTPATALPGGPHSLTATATDAAGNVSAAATFRAIQVDLAAPAAPAVTGLTPASDTGSSDHDGVTATAAPTVTGTAEANATVEVFDGATSLGTTLADAAGGWSFTPGSNLALGTHQVHATAKDGAGNTGGASADAAVTITTAPAPYHLSAVASSGGLWLGDFEHISIVPAAGGPSLSAHDVLALPGGASPNVPLPPAVGGLVPMGGAHHDGLPLGAAPDVAPMLLLPDLIRHMG
ncbi:MAG: putative hemagglutinin/hemolysin-related protein, partial [Cyanobacteria bacterium RYN_339]|nr:putative hemagglutinin/hemolysin-related protein [Cyanobacteria bacterium RYN_339]